MDTQKITTKLEKEDIDHILDSVNRLWQAHHTGSDALCTLQNKLRDDILLMCDGYHRVFFVAATHMEHGRPKGFFVLSENEGKCDYGFAGSPAYYLTQEEAQRRADIANQAGQKQGGWEVRSIVRRVT